MTWPTAAYLFDSNILQLPTDDADIWSRFWEAWHLKRAISGFTTLGFTDSLFYPVGMSLDYYPYNMLQTAAFALLDELMLGFQAYSLIYMGIVLLTALTGIRLPFESSRRQMACTVWRGSFRLQSARRWASASSRSQPAWDASADALLHVPRRHTGEPQMDGRRRTFDRLHSPH